MGGQCNPHNWQVFDRPKQILKCAWCGRETHIGNLERQELQRLVLAYIPIYE